jgi:HEPN domain-containing protein
MNRSRDYASSLLRKATEDEQAMVLLMADASSADWIVGFHAQQAVEKAIKAVLTDRGVEYPLTHNLSVLLDHVRSAGPALPSDHLDLPALTPFGAMLRYETSSSSASPLDRAWAMGSVRRTLEWAQGLLGL